jgi:hypothetical protein
MEIEIDVEMNARTPAWVNEEQPLAELPSDLLAMVTASREKINIMTTETGHVRDRPEGT